MRIPTPETTVAIMYDNSIVHVEKEELAYPMSSFFADCGGIMGLFVGFNFIMILKLLISIVKKIGADWKRNDKVYCPNTDTDVKGMNK